MITCLDDLLQSSEYNSMRFGSSSDDWLSDSDRMERIEEAAAYGGDGSTHGEHIQDWRECLDTLNLPEEVAEAIGKEIDACEAWHVEHGSIDEVIG